MGGSLKLVAEFPDRNPVILDGLALFDEDESRSQISNTSDPEDILSSQQLE